MSFTPEETQIFRDNMNKLGSWLTQGANSPNPLPPAITDFLQGYAHLQEGHAQLAKDFTALRQELEALKAAAPTQQETPAPVQQTAPAPVETLQSFGAPAAPVADAAQAIAPSVVPSPEALATPGTIPAGAVEVAATPAPAPAPAPAPVQQAAPAPVQQAAPAPVQQAAPATNQQAAPATNQQAAPAGGFTKDAKTISANAVDVGEVTDDAVNDINSFLTSIGV